MNEEYAGIVEMMAATLAHEVKNPLSLIRANIDYIELCDKEKKYINNYKIMRNELDRANEILYDFIAFMLPSPKNWKQIDISQVIDEILLSYQTTINTAIVFEKKYTQNCSLVKGDYQRLRVLIANVLKNAVEAQPTKIEIIISENDKRLSIQVLDNGVGITEETLEKLKSDIFYTTKRYGSGLGVNICKKITREHGGTYKISPRAGGGCKVEIELPLS